MPTWEFSFDLALGVRPVGHGPERGKLVSSVSPTLPAQEIGPRGCHRRVGRRSPSQVLQTGIQFGQVEKLLRLGGLKVSDARFSRLGHEDFDLRAANSGRCAWPLVSSTAGPVQLEGKRGKPGQSSNHAFMISTARLHGRYPITRNRTMPVNPSNSSAPEWFGLRASVTCRTGKYFALPRMRQRSPGQTGA
jgi:hypothetical protein